MQPQPSLRQLHKDSCTLHASLPGAYLPCPPSQAPNMCYLTTGRLSAYIEATGLWNAAKCGSCILDLRLLRQKPRGAVTDSSCAASRHRPPGCARAADPPPPAPPELAPADHSLPRCRSPGRRCTPARQACRPHSTLESCIALMAKQQDIHEHLTDGRCCPPLQGAVELHCSWHGDCGCQVGVRCIPCTRRCGAAQCSGTGMRWSAG